MSQVDGIGSDLGQVVVNKATKNRQESVSGSKSFSRMVEEGMEKLNGEMIRADSLSARLAAGKELDIPEVMLSITKADISFRMFVQMRNKALSAYEEIMRLQF